MAEVLKNVASCDVQVSKGKCRGHLVLHLFIKDFIAKPM